VIQYDTDPDEISSDTDLEMIDAPSPLQLATIEVFSGSARLTKALSAAGFDAVGIDYKQSKVKPEGKTVWMDLTTNAGASAFESLVERLGSKLVYVHFAPPQVTAARGRTKRLAGQLDPLPLRSEEYPDGLPNLEGDDLLKVLAENKLYKFTANTFRWLAEKGISCSIENPTNSLMWDTKPFRTLGVDKQYGFPNYTRHTMQMCMHGGGRPKLVDEICLGKVDFSALARLCDNSHTHIPWSVTRIAGKPHFARAEEKSYPPLYCRRKAEILAKCFGVKPPEHNQSLLKAAAGTQPRKLKPLVMDFMEYKIYKATRQELDTLAALKPGSPGKFRDDFFPNGAKQLSVNDDMGQRSGLSFVKLGVCWVPKNFVACARALRHPVDETPRLDPEICNVIYTIATKGPSHVERLRKEAISKYSALRDSLAERERALHSSLHPDVEKVVKDKNILLFKRMLVDIGYDDVAVADLLVTGVKLVGELERLPMWEADHTKNAVLTLEALLSGARQAQRKVIESGADTSWSKEDAAVAQATIDEKESGLLEGPYEAAELEKILGPLWIAARRFPIVQGDKTRPIDDFSEFDVNRSYGAKHRLRMNGVETVVALARAWIESVSVDRKFSLTDEEGTVWQGVLHEGWTPQSWKKLVGRLTDLKSAYKQLASHPASAFVSVIGVRLVPGVVSFFRAHALMFGATAAVYAFLRFSRAIARLGLRIMSVLVVEFFDDFSQIEAAELAESGRESFLALFDLLGWKVADSEAKSKPFAECFVTLGAEVDLSNACLNEEISVGNKPGRAAKIARTVEEAVARPLGLGAALSLRGLLVYAEGYTHARLSAPALRAISEWVRLNKVGQVPDESFKHLLLAAAKHIEHAKPRTVKKCHSPPVVVFVDGACEQEGTSIGGVLLDGHRVECFGATLPSHLVAEWKTRDEQWQVIGQAEIFPLLVARLTWREVLRGRRVIYFLDNDSARQAAIRSYSPVPSSVKILMQMVEFDFVETSLPWYTRVPTEVNVADEPSRMKYAGFVEEMNAKIVSPKYPDGWHSEEEMWATIG